MERDRKRSRTADGGGGSGSGGERKKERETKGKEPVVVVPPPTEDEVDEFFAILRRMREAVKYFEKSKDRPEPSREAADGKVCEKRTGGAILDLNTVPDDGE